VFKKLRILISDKLHAGRSFSSGGCRKYEARLEDYLQGNLQSNYDSDLNEHLRQCGGCRTALENSRMGGELLRDSWKPAGEAPGAFVAGVMAKIRAEEMRAESPAAFWNPLEFLASRLSLTAATVLFALSVYMLGFAPRRPPTLSPSARTELNAADFPQPPGDPESNEEVLQSLVERNYGR
jgi:predicted anti-sigma-YlaC factor YlaD